MTLEELIAALEKAEGPSRELDRAIQCTIGGWHRVTPSQGGGKHGAFISPSDWIGRDSSGRPMLDSMHGTTMHRDVPSVTGSIDAAVALVNRVLPGWRIENLSEWDAEILRDQGPWMCDLVQQGLEFFDRQSAKCSHAPTAALALVTATLKAKLSQEKNNAE